MAPLDETARRAVRDLLDRAIVSLERAGVESSRLDAELLLMRAAGTSRVKVLIGDVALDPETLRRFGAMVQRRADREPLAYIVGTRDFYSLEFRVTPDVLIPRPETETLVAAAIDQLATRPNARILDVGTGSGAIAIAILVNTPQVTAVGVDISAKALKVAQQNATRLCVEDRIVLRRGDCFDPLDDRGRLGTFDLIVANPPYIVDSQIETLQPEVAQYEPHLALAGGPDGLEFYRRIANGLDENLIAGGRLMLEIGNGQAAAVTVILGERGYSVIERRADQAGIVRVLISDRKSS
jgi:release factor glutamine methyltransferase